MFITRSLLNTAGRWLVRIKRVAVFAMAGVVLSTLSGCLPQVAEEELTKFHGTFIYTAYSSTQSIGILQIDPNSGLVTQAAPDYTMGDQPSNVLAHPTRPYLYVTSGTGEFIDGFRINPDTGELTELPGMPIATAGESPRGMTWNSDGSQLFVANGTGTSVTFRFYDLDFSTGVLTEAAGSPTNESSSAYFVVWSPQGFLYTGQPSQFVYGYSFPGGVATTVPNAPGISGTLDPQLGTVFGQNLYVVSDGRINSFLINASTGELTLSVQVGTSDNNGAIARHPTLPVLYWASDTLEEVQVYALDGAGEPIASPVGQETGARSSRFMFGPGGRLYFSNTFGDGSAPTITSMYIDPSTGVLSDRVEWFTPGGAGPADATMKSF